MGKLSESGFAGFIPSWHPESTIGEIHKSAAIRDSDRIHFQNGFHLGILKIQKSCKS